MAILRGLNAGIFSLFFSLLKVHLQLRGFSVFLDIERLNAGFFSLFFSLLKVHLQLRGFSVFLDIERLNAGKFDEGLLTSISQSKNFILVLTQDALERCKGDTQKKDWVHRVRACR